MARTHDLPLKEIVDLALEVRAQACSFEAGNVRHQHEWTLWKDVKLPAGKIIVPGVVSHATNLIEHPELIAQRICNFAEAVGRDNVVAGTDCGLGSRLHEDLVWAKLNALVEGARLCLKGAMGAVIAPVPRTAYSAALSSPPPAVWSCRSMMRADLPRRPRR